MKGFISKTMTVAFVSGGLALAGGCETYRNLRRSLLPGTL